jgi:hypothetical protein
VIRKCLLYTLRLAAMSAAALLLASQSTIMEGQTNASVSGTVVDPRGALMLNTAVDVKSVATGAERHTATDGQGHYEVSGLAAGRYTV